MIYTLTWNVNDEVFSICGPYKSIWRAYRHIREGLRGTQFTQDVYMKCIDCFGIPINLEDGINPHRAPAGKEKLLIAKGTFFHTRNGKYDR